ncbi:bestrophin-2-like isoform X1 [Cherax quadricarinatus]|uniref:bestrophin-2-like isoform X1 n=2 Tax=Cherax quadricarinatus TaxID=27406 RepID=UPI00387E2370
MTVEYTKTMVNTCCCIYVKLLFRWRGSMYKLLWRDLLAYTALYSTLSCVYRFYLQEPYKRMFEELVMYSSKYKSLVPVSFMLGMYVMLVMIRWWSICLALPDNTNIAMLLATHIPGTDSRAFEIRSRIVRYISLTCAMVFAQISGTVHSKYPDSQHLVQEYLATELEGQVLTEAAKQGCAGSKWLPLTWCCQLVQCAREEGFLQTDSGKEVLVTELLRLRRQCSRLQQWHEHNVPLLYTQVVTIAAYTYFVISLLSEQYLDESLKYPSYEVDLVVPAFALLELVFYMGWLKVAEILLNPFGTNDHSFDLLRILEDTRYSAFVICHTRYGQYSAEAQWKSREGRLHIIDLGVLPGMLGEVLTPDTVLGAST